MDRVLKWLGLAMAAVIALFAAAVMLLYLAVDEPALKRALANQVRERTGATLRTDGELVISALPSPTLVVSDIGLRPAGALDGEELASAARLRLGVRLWPLLFGSLAIDEIAIDGLIVRAARAPDGRGNWETLFNGEQSTSSPGNDAPAPLPEAGVAPPRIAIERLRIDDARIELDDQRSQERTVVLLRTLSGSGVNLRADPFGLELSARAESDRRAFDLSLRTQIAIDASAGSLALAETRIDLTPDGQAPVQLTFGDVSVAAKARVADIATWSTNSGPVEARGTAHIDWSGPHGVTVSGTLNIARLDVGAVADVLGVAWPGVLARAPLAAATLTTNFTAGQGRFALESLRLGGAGFAADGSLSYTSGKPPRLDAELRSPSFDLDTLLVKTAAAGTEAPAPQTAATTAPSATLAANENPAALELPWLEGRLALDVGTLKYGGIALQDTRATFVLRPGRADLESLRASLYGGTVDASARLDTREAGGASLAGTLKSVELRPLLAAAEAGDRFSGRLDAELKLQTVGSDPSRWMHTLAGPVTFSVHEPVVHGISADEVICKAAATLNRETLSATFAPDTRFDRFDAGLRFAMGVGEFDTLTATLPDMALRGEGRIDLPRRELDIHIDARLTDDLADRDPACRTTRKMQRIEWPVSCRGSFDEDPQNWCGIDRDDLAKIAAQLARENLGDKLKDKLGDFFRRN